MAGEWRETALVLIYGASLMAFFGCLALPVIRGRVSLRVLLFATTAACIALTILADCGVPWPELAD